MKRKIYHVVWRNGEWHVRRPRARRSTAVFHDKKFACVYAAIWGLNAPSSQFVVHYKNGRIQSKYTRGGDPRGAAG